MSHLGARVLIVLRENRPYELRDHQGNPVSKEEARRIILLEYKVAEEIRRQRRRRNSRKLASSKRAKGKGRFGVPSISEAATAPHPGIPPSLPKDFSVTAGY